MKKLSYLLLATFVVFAMSCKNENEEPPAVGDPTVTAPGSATSVVVGKVVTLDFSVTAPGKVATVAAVASAGTAVTVSPNPIIGQTSGVVTVTYTAPLADGPATVTLTITDAQDPAKTASAIANVDVTLGPTSTSELLVATFASAPTMDGDIDDMWNVAQRLVGTATVPSAGARDGADFNNDGSTPVPAGVFDPYTDESNDFTLRAGTNADMIYFLLEWDDAEDSKDRQSWYFDDTDNLWKGQHKYANTDDDKYYEDKFAFLWAATDVSGFAGGTCYVTCHTDLTLVNPTDKTARHYTNNDGEIVDMWHWKRVRSTFPPTVIDDQQMVYKAHTGNSDVNGRTGDEGTAGYHGNSQTLQLDGTGADVSVPLYIIPEATDYNWITLTQIDDETAKLVIEVTSAGVLTYEETPGGATGTIDPAGGDYEAATGTKRFPSVWVENFTGSRADLAVSAMHTGSGWVVEFSRKLDTTHDDDVLFDVTKEFPFGLALFNNAAIAHEIKVGLLMKFE